MTVSANLISVGNYLQIGKSACEVTGITWNGSKIMFQLVTPTGRQKLKTVPANSSVHIA